MIYNIIYPNYDNVKKKEKVINMKIISIGEPKVIMSNPTSHHNYFAWPTIARLQNGKIAVVASGFRLGHVCPFGKTVISYSDDGETYTLPSPVIDTVLDDRDGGVATFGKSGVIVTSFNNTVEFQRVRIGDPATPWSRYKSAYLDFVSEQAEKEALGSSFRMSDDFGVAFGPIFKSPITSPHGPVELHDGTLLWVGRTFSPDDTHRKGEDCIKAYKINRDGSMDFVGQIERIYDGSKELLSCEPHAVELDDGTILVHIRVQDDLGSVFTIYQSESHDGGKTWSTPRQILERLGGSPPHIIKHSSGTLICTYGYRQSPTGIKAMFSRDNGKTWDTDNRLYTDVTDVWDIGYPSTVELEDKSLITVFYAHLTENGPAVILSLKWRFEDEI